MINWPSWSACLLSSVLLLLPLVVQPNTDGGETWNNRHSQARAAASGRASSSARETATPWLLPPNIRMPYEGLHNNLNALLRVQSTREGWVSVFMFSAGVSWWTMNCIYSYIKYGRSVSYILAAPDVASLEACLKLRLPCLNMSAAGMDEAPEATATTAQAWKTDAYYSLVWAKVGLVASILRAGHHVHFSDVDVVYLREVWSSYQHVFSAAGPDAIFMEEQWQVDGDPVNKYVNMFNTGVYAIRSNNRSLAFMDQWYGSGAKKMGNQPFINSFAARAGTSFAFCYSAPSCNLLKRRKRAALLLHPPQSRHAACPPGSPLTSDDMCGDNRLFIHYICSPAGWGATGRGSKGFMLNGHKLRLLDDMGKPLYADAEGGLGRPRHPVLPCSEGTAWLHALPVALNFKGDPFPLDNAD